MSKKSSKSSKQSAKPRIDPNDVGLSKKEADELIDELGDITQEEVDKQARDASDRE